MQIVLCLGSPSCFLRAALALNEDRKRERAPTQDASAKKYARRNDREAQP
jgi:hypothetical protein